MSSFRKSYTVRKKSEGSWVEGLWVEGSETPVTILASFQPMNSDEKEFLEVGRRDIGKIKGYSDEDLTAGEVDGQKTGDIVEFYGSLYEILKKDMYKSDVINHYKYIAEYRGKI